MAPPAKPRRRRWGAAAFALALVSPVAPGVAQSLPSIEWAGAATRGSSRVVGGERVGPGAFPSKVAIAFQAEGRWAAGCGGTIIDPEWVLTAAHCVVQRGAARPAASLLVVEGTTNLEQGGRPLRVREVVVHPQFRDRAEERGGIFADIALLRLAEPARQPRQTLLSPALRDAGLAEGLAATITGFGQTQARGASPQLLQVNLPLVSQAVCERAYPGAVFPHNVCAGLEEGGRDACQGDSGGPLFVRGIDGAPVQAGIVSWGEGCARPGRFGVYAALPDFEPFIRHYVPNAVFAERASATPPITGPGGGGTQLPPGQGGQVSVEILPAGPVRAGTRLRIRVESSVPGVLVLMNISAAGQVTQLFPNRLTAAQPGAFQAAQQIRPGVPVTVPGPEDRFALTAGPPFGENAIVAVIAPPGARVLDLLAENDALQPVRDPAALFERLSERLAEARRGQAAMPVEYQGTRQIQVVPVQPALPAAERRFRIVP